MLHPSWSAQNLNRRVSKNIDLVHKKKTQCTIEMHICKLLNLLSGMVIHEVIISYHQIYIYLIAIMLSLSQVRCCSHIRFWINIYCKSGHEMHGATANLTISGYDIITHKAQISKQLMIMYLTISQSSSLIMSRSMKRLLTFSTYKVLGMPRFA